MKRTTALLILLPLAVLSLFFLTEIWSALCVHWEGFAGWWKNHNSSYYPWYIWVAAGSVVFPLMNRFFEKNIKMTKTFTHELTHTITALLTFRRIHSFEAKEDSGVVYTSGKDSLHFLTTLAPYCFPVYTFPLMVLRCMIIPVYYPIIDIMIGFTVGLHIICFKEQTGDHQTDINRFPHWFSYSYILGILIFDVCLILISYEPSLNIFYAFKTLGMDFWNGICNLVG